eukprot:s6218_g1.t1
MATQPTQRGQVVMVQQLDPVSLQVVVTPRRQAASANRDPTKITARQACHIVDALPPLPLRNLLEAYLSADSHPDLAEYGAAAIPAKEAQKIKESLTF